MPIPAITPEALLESLHWRYATKHFDPARTIPEELWSAIEDAIVLTPSSYGLQPWRFIVVTEPALKATLRPLSWNQAQITDCSHLVVLAARTVLTEAHLDRYVARNHEQTGKPLEKLQGYKKYMMKDLVDGPHRRDVRTWAANQTYIAFGQMMVSAAVLGIDTCPIEGLEPAKYDAVLGLPEHGFATLAVCAFGYRAATDQYAKAPRIRYPKGEIIERR